MGRNYAVLMCAEDSEYIKQKYGGYFHVFVTFLSEEGDKWDVYKVALGEFPTEEEILKLDGFVVTGSCNDAHGDDLWICELMNLLKKVVLMDKKILGICFGHQILCRALGGTTGRSATGWDIGVTKIETRSASNSKPFTSLKLPEYLKLIECHQDEVMELPHNAELIGTSNKTRVEMVRYGEHLMGIQGHPEYTKDILLHLIDRLMVKKCISKEFADSVRIEAEEVEEGEADREVWRMICRKFLKGTGSLELTKFASRI